jgi:tripartite-type tricarboxylate transporter receptor subunit TctC
MKTMLKAVVLLLLAGSGAGHVLAQQYPAKPIRMIIGFPPGGGTDIIGRIVAMRLSEVLGQQILPDNRGGASGQIAAELTAKAPPDGYTVMMAHISAMSILPSLYPKLPYDPVKDFAPVTLVAISPNLVTVHPTLPVKNVKELIALAKARPGQIHYESPGLGTVQHLAGELFKLQAKVDLLHVPYKGAGPAIIDLVAGHVQLGFDVIPVAGPQVKAGKLRALGVTSAKRSALFPELPTVTESGVADFDMSTWWGLVAPAAVSKDAIARLHSAAVKVLRQKDTASLIAEQGAEVVGNTPAEFASFIGAERVKYARIVRDAKIKIE